jgi:hypothetical protein
MEAVVRKHDFTGMGLEGAVAGFFGVNSLEGSKVLFWTFFQCWVTRECKLKADLSDEEVALFFDQLLELLTVLYEAKERGELRA